MKYYGIFFSGYEDTPRLKFLTNSRKKAEKELPKIRADYENRTGEKFHKDTIFIEQIPLDTWLDIGY